MLLLAVCRLALLNGKMNMPFVPASHSGLLLSAFVFDLLLQVRAEAFTHPLMFAHCTLKFLHIFYIVRMIHR